MWSIVNSIGRELLAAGSDFLVRERENLTTMIWAVEEITNRLDETDDSRSNVFRCFFFWYFCQTVNIDFYIHTIFFECSFFVCASVGQSSPRFRSSRSQAHSKPKWFVILKIKSKQTLSVINCCSILSRRVVVAFFFLRKRKDFAIKNRMYEMRPMSQTQIRRLERWEKADA